MKTYKDDVEIAAALRVKDSKNMHEKWTNVPILRNTIADIFKKKRKKGDKNKTK